MRKTSCSSTCFQHSNIHQTSFHQHSSSWWFQPIWKNMLVQLDHFPNFRDGHKNIFELPPPRVKHHIPYKWQKQIIYWKHPNSFPYSKRRWIQKNGGKVYAQAAAAAQPKRPVGKGGLKPPGHGVAHRRKGWFPTKNWGYNWVVRIIPFFQ